MKHAIGPEGVASTKSWLLRGPGEVTSRPSELSCASAEREPCRSRPHGSAREPGPDSTPARIEQPVVDHACHSVPCGFTHHGNVAPILEESLAAQNQLRDLVNAHIASQVIGREPGVAIAVASEFKQQTLAR